MTEIAGRERERLAKKQIDCPLRCLSAMILTLYQLLGGELQTRPREWSRTISVSNWGRVRVMRPCDYNGEVAVLPL
jgi:hypothetical protein